MEYKKAFLLTKLVIKQYGIAQILLTAYLKIREMLQRLLENIYYYGHVRLLNKKVYASDFDKVIFVAHPDDEVLFFSNQLFSEPGWLVVCVTNGGNPTRSKEFIHAMEDVGAKYMMWNFKDGIDTAWSNSKIDKRVSEVLKIRDGWAKVLTHNDEGEYGHYQHKQVHQSVSRVYSGDNLFFTASNNELFKSENVLPLNVKLRKRYLIEQYYKSQTVVMNFLAGYFEYEQQQCK